MPPAALANTFQALDINLENERPHFTDEVVKRSKQKKIERCIELLEHTGSCQDLRFCSKGEGCRRTKQVLYHHLICPKTWQKGGCSICRQLVALCHIHTIQCQNDELSCYVPYCRNEKPLLPGNRHQNKTQNSNPEQTTKEFRQVVGKLLKAMRMTSIDEKFKILQLFYGNPKSTTTLLKHLCKVKPPKK